MKKGMIISASVLAALCGLVWLLLFAPPVGLFLPDTTLFRTQDRQIQRFQEGQWENFEIVGVNIGTGAPGLFPNETGISQDTYYRWMEQIADMNANTIRVYKIQSPDFYSALYRYNRTHQRKLYLLQGIDFSDELMYSEENLLTSPKKQQLLAQSRQVIDAVHGRKLLLDAKNGQLHCYVRDVSPWLIGYIPGVEWDEMFVEYLNRINPQTVPYQGTYLSAGEEASAFESFLAQWGDEILRHEQKTYGRQSLITYCNWPLTDPLYNEFETQQQDSIYQMADCEAVVDLEHLTLTDSCRSGLFASYNVYPYFPYYLQHGPYTEFVDDSGKRNPYLGYLTALREHHSMPVVISEYGVPASRSVTYQDIWRGIGHGGLTEAEQGQAVVSLFQDIRKSGCAGSILFTWQDEWYKTAWNEGLISDPDGRAYWSNAQCAEESFGLLAFEPGLAGETFYPDGDISEWEEVPVVSQNDRMQLRIHSDEKYMYFLVTGAQDAAIALDIAPFCGASRFSGTDFDRDVDFLIQIQEDGTGVLLVQAYYDALVFSAIGGYHEVSAYMMNKLNTEQHYGMPSRDTDRFWRVTRAAGNIQQTLQGRWIRAQAGVLKAGNANPAAPDFDSNADFMVCPQGIEIRIPWQLLNFYDPSQRMILNDFRENNFHLEGMPIRSIYAAAYQPGQRAVFGTYRLREWDQPQFHERLKASYYIVQEAFGKVNAP